MTRYARVATHEAGHALAAMYQGLQIDLVCVHPDGEGGSTSYNHIPGHDPQTDAFIAMSGAIAERMLCGSTPDQQVRHRTDYNSAWGAALQYSRDDHNGAARMLGEVRQDAEMYIAQHLDQIAGLAQELSVRGQMTGDDIVSYLRGW